VIEYVQRLMAEGTARPEDRPGKDVRASEPAATARAAAL
jgi:hypothetical protein